MKTGQNSSGGEQIYGRGHRLEILVMHISLCLFVYDFLAVLIIFSIDEGPKYFTVFLFSDFIKQTQGAPRCEETHLKLF